MITAESMRKLIERRCKAGSYNQVGQEVGVAGQTLANIVAGRSTIGNKVAGGFGFERVVRYRKVTT